MTTHTHTRIPPSDGDTHTRGHTDIQKAELYQRHNADGMFFRYFSSSGQTHTFYKYRRDLGHCVPLVAKVGNSIKYKSE